MTEDQLQHIVKILVKIKTLKKSLNVVHFKPYGKNKKSKEQGKLISLKCYYFVFYSMFIQIQWHLLIFMTIGVKLGFIEQ